MSDARGMFGAREAPCRSVESTVVRVGASPWGSGGCEREDRSGSEGHGVRRMDREECRASERTKRRRAMGQRGRKAVGVPSYLVIYSPRAPGYPSRGITQGWAHRTPKMSLLAGHRRAAPPRGISAREQRRAALERARPPFRLVTRVSSSLGPPSGDSVIIGIISR